MASCLSVTLFVIPCIINLINFVLAAPADNGTNYEFSEDQQYLFSICPELLSDPIDIAESGRYDNATKRCYETNNGRGPCGNNMRFVAKDNIYGYCSCDDIGSNTRPPFLFDRESNQCYFMFTKGNCGQREWVVADRITLEAICIPNICLLPKEVSQARNESVTATTEDPYAVMVPYLNRCVRFGAPQPECEKKFYIIGVTDLYEVDCVGATSYGASGVIQRKNTCAQGTYLTITGKCQSGWKWA